MARAQDGWLATPRLLNADGDFAEETAIPIGNTFRFEVPNDSKLRRIGDLTRSLADTSCAGPYR